MHKFDRRTDGRTDRILIARPRLYCTQRGNKTAKINFTNSGAVDIIRTAYCIHGPELMTLFLSFFVIKRVFYNY